MFPSGKIYQEGWPALACGNEALILRASESRSGSGLLSGCTSGSARSLEVYSLMSYQTIEYATG
ncbi:MAG: hypothetical protein JRF71_03060 [Deltaproteobacteria bacterium]|nr:hypothetical protein [Deltaproteobacteria bacterium]MBW2199799.1 hypothetical protein [Deltaproteobacteria bacterium]